MPGHRAAWGTAYLGEQADGGEALAVDVGKSDQTLEGPAQVGLQGSIDRERNRNIGEHGSLLGMPLPWQERVAKFRRLREARFTRLRLPAPAGYAEPASHQRSGFSVSILPSRSCKAKRKMGLPLSSVL